MSQDKKEIRVSNFDKEFPDLPKSVSSTDTDYYKVKCDQYEYMIAVLRDMPEIDNGKLENLGIPLSSQVSSPECVLLGIKYLIRDMIKKEKLRLEEYWEITGGYQERVDFINRNIHILKFDFEDSIIKELKFFYSIHHTSEITAILENGKKYNVGLPILDKFEKLIQKNLKEVRND